MFFNCNWAGPFWTPWEQRKTLFFFPPQISFGGVLLWFWGMEIFRKIRLSGELFDLRIFYPSQAEVTILFLSAVDLLVKKLTKEIFWDFLFFSADFNFIYGCFLWDTQLVRFRFLKKMTHHVKKNNFVLKSCGSTDYIGLCCGFKIIFFTPNIITYLSILLQLMIHIWWCFFVF